MGFRPTGIGNDHKPSAAENNFSGSGSTTMGKKKTGLVRRQIQEFRLLQQQRFLGWVSIRGYVMQQWVVASGCKDRFNELQSATTASLASRTDTLHNWLHGWWLSMDSNQQRRSRSLISRENCNMASSYNLVLLILVFAGAFLESNCKLTKNFYKSKCPKALSIVQEEVTAAIKNETRVGASLLRLHFHDCFVNGCDASVLLDDTSNFVGEKTAVPNNNSIRGFEVVDGIKAKLEKACPGVVSCADLLALAARDSVVYLGGPSWKVRLGRRDSTTASRSAANTSIPPPTSNISALISSFSAQGLSLRDLVALSGSHTIGLARCTSFRSRIYNESTINAAFAKSLQGSCPRSGSDNNLASLDLQTPTHFDNLYYKNLLKEKGLLHSDQELYNGTSTDKLVKKYANNTFVFFKHFAKAMVKMGNIDPLTGSQGEIRTNCRKVN